MRRSRISGVGLHVPARCVRTEELEEPLDITARSIERKTGIRQRFWNDDPELSTSDLGAEAARAALAQAGLAKEAVDMIVFATLSPDAAAPGSGCFLQKKLDLPGIPAFDVRQQCSGFLYGLSLADLYVRAGECEHVLLVGAEMQSKLLDMTPRGRKVTTLFGDGAGAVIVSATEVEDASGDSPESFLRSTHLHCDGGLLDHLLWQHPGTTNPTFLTRDLFDEPESFPQMRGRELFDICLDRMPAVSREALESNGLSAADVDLVVMHQTNVHLNEGFADVMGIAREKVFSTVETFGNTTAATIPIGLAEAVREGRLTPGMLVLSCSFGSGISWAAAVYRW